ncbi:hypothetical protein C1S70_31380 (plasmid) [Azospirillum argentinense]|uniref:Uncharacterized protein n=1 Tax=Azospirillum argentinense TaxID=2970906 RepID=A0A2K1FR00_9PROT|nr:hypothetical protein [Azospirillum argentinense]PNQ94960.1 hypothetical protein C1S70_31380 [Azospirillum argentinense]
MQTVKHPYELLVRWDQSGALQGAHVQYRYVIRDGEDVIGETIGQALPLTLEAADGFPLGDLLSQVQIDALTGMAAAVAARDTALARVAELEALLDAVQSAAMAD